MKSFLDYFSGMTFLEACTYAGAIIASAFAVRHFRAKRRHKKAAWWDSSDYTRDLAHKQAKDREADRFRCDGGH